MSRFESPDMQLIELLRKSDRPSSEDMQRVRKAVAIEVAVGLSATTAAVAASQSLWGAKLGALITWGKGLLLMTSLVGVGVGLTLYAKPEALLLRVSRPNAPVATLSEPTIRGEQPTVQQTALPESDESDELSKGTVPQGSSSRVRTNLVPKSSRNGASTLGAELELLGRSQRALKAGQPSEALRALDEHARKYPNGVLTLERLGVRTIALCQTGRLADGRAAAKSYLHSAPNSVLSKRIRIACQLSDE
ncbi:MAG TPA: hypothetical protein VIV60_11240 [Polyangiaceae bacterium]